MVISQKKACPVVPVELEGELSRRLTPTLFRVISIVTGFFFIRAVGSVVLRYCLTFRRRAKVSCEGKTLVLDVHWSIFGKSFRHTKTVTQISDIPVVQLENRQRYVHLLVGFGFLVVGALVGIQWFVDGLRAGYPYLALVGAGIVLGGTLINLSLYLLVPKGSGKSRLVLAMGPWTMRVCGVEHQAAERLLDVVRSAWK
jgi:hypothetical protein